MMLYRFVWYNIVSYRIVSNDAIISCRCLLYPTYRTSYLYCPSQSVHTILQAATSKFVSKVTTVNLKSENETSLKNILILCCQRAEEENVR